MKSCVQRHTVYDWRDFRLKRVSKQGHTEATIIEIFDLMPTMAIISVVIVIRLWFNVPLNNI